MRMCYTDTHGLYMASDFSGLYSSIHDFTCRFIMTVHSALGGANLIDALTSVVYYAV